VAHLYNIKKNVELETFDLKKIVTYRPTTQQEVDGYQKEIESLPFYRGLLYNDSTRATLMMIFVNAEKFNSDKRGDVIDLLQARIETFSQQNETHTAVSGLPYIRTVTSKRVQSELLMFVMLAAIVTAFILFLFFRSLKIVVFCLLGHIGL